MGADPEAEVLDELGNIIQASYLVSDPNNNKTLGLDGCPDVVELRPKPGNWNSVRFKIKKIIEEADKKGLRLVVAGDTYAIGGHIHFAIHGKTRDIADAMDSYIYPLFDKLQGDARGSYGQRGAIEYKRYGFEYRSLPAGWIATPVLCKLTLKLAYKIALSVLKYGLVADGEPVTIEYSNYRHFINKRDFATLLQEIDRVAKALYRPINSNWVKESKAERAYSYSFRDEYNVGSDIKGDFNDLPIPIVFFGLKEERGENLVYCPRIPRLAEVVGATNYASNDLWRFNTAFPLHIGLSPDLRKADIIIKILEHVRNHHK